MFFIFVIYCVFVSVINLSILRKKVRNSLTSLLIFVNLYLMNEPTWVRNRV